MTVTVMGTLQNYLLTAGNKKSKATSKLNGNEAKVIFAYNIQRTGQHFGFLRKREVSSSLFEY